MHSAYFSFSYSRPYISSYSLSLSSGSTLRVVSTSSGPTSLANNVYSVTLTPPPNYRLSIAFSFFFPGSDFVTVTTVSGTTLLGATTGRDYPGANSPLVAAGPAGVGVTVVWVTESYNSQRASEPLGLDFTASLISCSSSTASCNSPLYRPSASPSPRVSPSPSALPKPAVAGGGVKVCAAWEVLETSSVQIPEPVSAAGSVISCPVSILAANGSIVTAKSVVNGACVALAAPCTVAHRSLISHGYCSGPCGSKFVCPPGMPLNSIVTWRAGLSDSELSALKLNAATNRKKLREPAWYNIGGVVTFCTSSDCTCAFNRSASASGVCPGPTGGGLFGTPSEALGCPAGSENVGVTTATSASAPQAATSNNSSGVGAAIAVIVVLGFAVAIFFMVKRAREKAHRAIFMNSAHQRHTEINNPYHAQHVSHQPVMLPPLPQQQLGSGYPPGGGGLGYPLGGMTMTPSAYPQMVPPTVQGGYPPAPAVSMGYPPQPQPSTSIGYPPPAQAPAMSMGYPPPAQAPAMSMGYPPPAQAPAAPVGGFGGYPQPPSSSEPPLPPGWQKHGPDSDGDVLVLSFREATSLAHHA